MKEVLFTQVILNVNERHGKISQSSKTALYTFMRNEILRSGNEVIAINGTLTKVHLLMQVNLNTDLTVWIDALKEAARYWIRNFDSSLARFEWEERVDVYTYASSWMELVSGFLEKQVQWNLFTEQGVEGFGDDLYTNQQEQELRLQ